MTSLLSAKKRAEEFAAVVDGGADESTLRPELAELLVLVDTLQHEAQVGAQLAPRPEFTATLREQLMAEAATSLASDNLLMLPTRRKGTRERRMALVASSLVFVGGTAGMAAAAQNALPGEALYPIKRGLEKAQTGLATSQAAKGDDLLAQADSRLVEVRGLFDSATNLSQVPGTIDDFTRQALEASDVIIEEFENSRDAALIKGLRTFAADNLGELQELSAKARPEHQDELAIAAEALMQIDARAQTICPSCASQLGSLEMPTLFLTANEARAAIDAAGRVVVDNSHPVITGAVPSEPSGDGKDKAPTGAGKDEAPAGGGQDDELPGTEAPGDTGTDTGTGDPGTDSGSDPVGVPTEVDAGGQGSDGKTAPEILDEVTGGVDGSAGGIGSTGGSTDGDGGGKGAKDAKNDGNPVLPDELEDAAQTLSP